MSPSCRGDWTPLELFIVGVRGWDARSRQCLEKLTFKRASAGSSRLADLVGLHPFLKGTQGLGCVQRFGPYKGMIEIAWTTPSLKPSTITIFPGDCSPCSSSRSVL